MTPDEVRMLDNRYALLFIRGERPVKDLKYDILKHPNVKLTTDGGTEPYKHGEDTRSYASILFDREFLTLATDWNVDGSGYELLSEEELEEILKMEEIKHEQ